MLACVPGLKPPSEEMVLGQVRDWNEDLQTARELPADTLPDKIFKERILLKVSPPATHDHTHHLPLPLAPC